MTDAAGQVVAAGGFWASVLEAGQRLRITDLEGGQGVDFLCYNADRPEERYHAPNTLKAARDLRLTAGHTLYSDEARALLAIEADTYGGHDTIAGCCSAASNKLLYGVRDRPGCRENFLEALRPYGLGRRDLVPNVNFFCSVPVTPEQKLISTVFTEGSSRAGDYVELRAEMRVLAVISNCPQVNNPCNRGCPTPIEVAVSG